MATTTTLQRGQTTPLMREVWTSKDDFLADFNAYRTWETYIDGELVFILLASKYADSAIKYFDDYAFKNNVFADIYINRGLLKADKLIEEVRAAVPQELGQSDSLLNQAANNSGNQGVDTQVGVTQLDGQTRQYFNRTKIDTLMAQISVSSQSLLIQFVNGFSKHFVTFLAPYVDIAFIHEEEESGEEQ